MADDDIIEYINNKKDLITDDYKVKYFVEFLFYKGQDKVYENQVTQLEKKLLSADNGSNAIQIKKFLNTDPFKNAKREGETNYSKFKNFLINFAIFCRIESLSSSQHKWFHWYRFRM